MRASRPIVGLLVCALLGRVAAAQATPPQALEHRTPEDVERANRAERHITLDVEVSDASGNPVGGLDAQDFSLLVNGRPQAISAVHRLKGTGTVPPAEVILLLDALNPTFQDVSIARQGIEKFLRREYGHLAQPVSLVFLADDGAKLEPASRDGNALAEDLAKLKSPIRTFDVAQGASGLLERAQRSVHALTQLATLEAARPGRKLLLWVGPGWPLLSGPSATLSAENKRRYFATIVDLNTALRRAQMTLYSIAPLNLAQGTGLRSFLYQDFLKGVESPAQADAPDLALQVLAYQSGGLVLNKSGDLAGQIARAAADANVYYELSFDSSAGVRADEYRRLEVRVDKPGIAARTATGYYAQP